MAKINLLPWREELRKQKQTEFFIAVGITAVLAVAIWGVVHLYHTKLIDYHKMRNEYVQTEIAKLDKKIKQIEALEKEKARLLARMRAIEQLQGNRPLIVRFFDELVKVIPEGVSILSLTQRGSSITVTGEAQSNARVSNFMRNIDKSEWLKNPKLDVIQANDKGNQRISSFTLRFSQKIPTAEGEDGA